ncbi:hypothetical protein [Carnimonas bestiolae]|uniref:hypothetical protein n=1 Tax=Carnimonas bestiolae TaxID=3402172 RepID=UPI003EDBCFFC
MADKTGIEEEAQGVAAQAEDGEEGSGGDDNQEPATPETPKDREKSFFSLIQEKVFSTELPSTKGLTQDEADKRYATSEDLKDAVKKSDLESYAKTSDVKDGYVAKGDKLDAEQVPNLDASKIATGTLDAKRIPKIAISGVNGLQSALDNKADKTAS